MYRQHNSRFTQDWDAVSQASTQTHLRHGRNQLQKAPAARGGGGGVVSPFADMKLMQPTAPPAEGAGSGGYFSMEHDASTLASAASDRKVDVGPIKYVPCCGYRTRDALVEATGNVHYVGQTTMSNLNKTSVVKSFPLKDIIHPAPADKLDADAVIKGITPSIINESGAVFARSVTVTAKSKVPCTLRLRLRNEDGSVTDVLRTYVTSDLTDEPASTLMESSALEDGTSAAANSSLRRVSMMITGDNMPVTETFTLNPVDSINLAGHVLGFEVPKADVMSSGSSKNLVIVDPKDPLHTQLMKDMRDYDVLNIRHNQVSPNDIHLTVPREHYQLRKEQLFNIQRNGYSKDSPMMKGVTHLELVLESQCEDCPLFRASDKAAGMEDRLNTLTEQLNAMDESGETSSSQYRTLMENKDRLSEQLGRELRRTPYQPVDIKLDFVGIGNYGVLPDYQLAASQSKALMSEMGLPPLFNCDVISSAMEECRASLESQDGQEWSASNIFALCPDHEQLKFYNEELMQSGRMLEDMASDAGSTFA